MGRSPKRAGHEVLVARRGTRASALTSALAARLAGGAAVLASAASNFLSVPHAPLRSVAAAPDPCAVRGFGRGRAHRSGI